MNNTYRYRVQNEQGDAIHIDVDDPLMTARLEDLVLRVFEKYGVTWESYTAINGRKRPEVLTDNTINRIKELEEMAELARDGQRFRALNRASWMCDAVCWAGDKAGGYQEPSAENENVAEMIESLDGSDEALDRLRAAVDAMLAASAQANE